MRFARIIADVAYKRIGPSADEIEVTSLVSDSRVAKEGSAFVCINGTGCDGHDFAPEAYRRGCRIFIVEHSIELPSDASQYQVSDTRIALARLSRAYYDYPEQKLLLVGVTGTKGKTTVSSMAMRLLCAQGIACGYIGSNGVIFDDVHELTANTTPESIELYRYFRRMVDVGIRVVVMEVSSQALYMHRVEGLTFPLTVFTNLAPDHIGGNEHPTFEHYRSSKASLFTDYHTETAIYNMDDDAALPMFENTTASRKIAYSLNYVNAHYYADRLAKGRDIAYMGTSFCLHHAGEEYPASLTMPGDFNVANALAALAIAHEVMMKLKYQGNILGQLIEKLPNVRVAGRFEVVPLFNDRAFIIDYAHNGYSLSAVFRVLREYQPQRLICLVGSVGGRTYGRRAEIGEALKDADFSIITSDNPDYEDPMTIINEIADAAAGCQYVKIADRAEAIAYAVRCSRPGDVILLAGKGHENYQLIDGVREPFCEMEILQEAVKEAAGTAIGETMIV